MIPDIKQLEKLVRQAAFEELVERFNRTTRHFKVDGSVLTEADLAMQARMHTELERRWPKFGFLGEEMSAEEQEKALAESGEGLWILDPLDGTSNFAAGLPCFSVSLALLQDGKVNAGVVFDPMLNECFSAVRGEGAWLNGERLGAVDEHLPLRNAIAAVDFKRLPADLAVRIARNPPYASQRSLGSVALDWCWVAAGRFHVYLHGKQKLWDYAAGSLILEEARGFNATLDGEPVFHPHVEPRSAVCALDKAVFEEWRHWLAGADSIEL